MRYSLFDQWGAKNSPPIWHAFRTGAARLGHTVVSHDMDADVAVIWSLVWSGRMRNNREIWQHFRKLGRPVIILEVGTLRRDLTWKMGINGLGNHAQWGQGIDPRRPQQIGLELESWRSPGRDVVIVLQRSDSEQWAGMPPMQDWLSQTVNTLRDHTDRNIRVRRHPRQATTIPYGCVVDTLHQLPNTKDDFDLTAGIASAWAVINVNSGAGVRVAIAGVPVFVADSSLAAPVGNLDWNQIENPQRPDREQWFINLCHTEWTREEIASGNPLYRLTQSI